MADSFFWDTHGFFSLLSSDDKKHKDAIDLLQMLEGKREISVTSDWVVGETCTLLTVRKKRHLANQFLQMLATSKALKIKHISEEHFAAARTLFIKRQDKSYSFTDCTSFVLMKSLKISEAVTEDAHFTEEGFKALLA
jgi:hypothetical protein